MNATTTIQRVVSRAKADAWCKAASGFAVARLSNGEVDYFPTGQPANIAGVPDRQAVILAKYSWNQQRWSRIA